MLELLSNKRFFIVQEISFVEKRLNNKRFARQALFEILARYLYFFLVRDFLLDKKNFSNCNQYENWLSNLLKLSNSKNLPMKRTQW